MKKIIFLFFIFSCFFITGCKKEKEKNYFQVDFYREGVLVSSVSVLEGTNALAPTVEKDGYDFVGWSEAITNIQSNLSIDAVFIPKSFKVTFLDGDRVLKEMNVNYGDKASAPIDFEKEGYIFNGWDKKFNKITTDLEVHALYTKREYSVTFYDYYGNILSEQIVKYEESAIVPDNKDLEGFNFLNWDKDYTSIKCDTIIYGIYEKYEGKLTYVIFGEEVDLGMPTYEVGKETLLPTPNVDGYIFNGWYISNISLAKKEIIEVDDTLDYILYADLVETKVHNPLKLEEGVLQFTEIRKVQSGSNYLYQPVFPVGKEASVTDFDWSVSDTTIASVSTWSSIAVKKAGYTLLYAKHKTVPSIVYGCIIKTTNDGVYLSNVEEANQIDLVTVTFKDHENNIIETVKIRKNDSVCAPIPKIIPGLVFTGWDKELYNITKDTTINATYKPGNSKYQGKKFSFIGDSISTHANYIPAGFSCFYPAATGDVNDMHQTWWARTADNFGSIMFTNNSYSGSCVASSNSSSTMNLSRLKHCLINGERPDVIFIYMGSNDAASQFVTLNAFIKGYHQMLDNLKELCPDSEIILMTLPMTRICSEENRTSFNQVIRDCANEYNLKLIDMANLNLLNDLIDSAHPSASGQKKIADFIASSIRN